MPCHIKARSIEPFTHLRNNNIRRANCKGIANILAVFKIINKGNQHEPENDININDSESSATKNLPQETKKRS